jgi:hypothetical protein
MNATCSDCNQNVAYLIDMKCINCVDNIYFDEQDDEYEYCFEDQVSIDLDEEKESIDLDEEEESIDLDEEKEENNKKVIDIEAVTAAAMSVASAAMAAMVAASKRDEPKTCSICLDDIDGKNNNMTTDCGHCFHTTCFLQHVSHNGFACPNCRNQIIEEPECESDDEEDDYDDEDEEDEEDDEENEDVDDFDYALRGMRWMFERVNEDEDDDDDDDYDDDDDESIDDETFERIQYERGHARFDEGNMQPISLSTISERIRLQGITYDDLVALCVFPHKDNAEDIAMYPHTRLMEIHSKVKDVLEGATMPVIEFSAEEANGKPLSLEDLTVDPSFLETVFDL